uniref:RNA polymerase subunit alpha n=1 Tax=Eustigmatophyceae sp. Chic 10/23 P-6w TaxID=1446905 RepID=A0A3R5U974_9STRA|nr:RNA polymerase subunit alpha [Eustigmatophyceae sp. Chic 10/23 P-6w]QAA11518.1 RNA polymerase subunit alpha [Eustigmatophyceae sp. Chic 10/23 P-6w]
MSQLMMKIEKRFVDKKTGQIFFQFQLGPFKRTMATTVGVALRRVMIGSSKTIAITSAHGDLYQGDSLREDVFEFSMNLQQVVIKSVVFPFLGTGKLQKKGPAIVTAGDIILPDGLELVNPYQYLCTLNEGYTLNLALVLSSPSRTRFESGIPLKSAVPLNTLGQINNSDENIPIQDLPNTINRRRKKKDLVDGEKNGKKLPNILTKDSPKSLPLDSILVDPIYAPVQSCSFEIINVVGSYFPEYLELTKSGLNQTPEYLRMSIVTNGSIEPVLAVQDAVHELYGALSLFTPLTHIFSSYYNTLLAFNFNELAGNRSNQIIKQYFDVICKKIDLANLGLSIENELSLRRNGISTLGHLISLPLSVLRTLGLTSKDFLEVKSGLNKLGFWKDITIKDWESL